LIDFYTCVKEDICADQAEDGGMKTAAAESCGDSGSSVAFRFLEVGFRVAHRVSRPEVFLTTSFLMLINDPAIRPQFFEEVAAFLTVMTIFAS
jgi:hypothetical protein